MEWVFWILVVIAVLVVGSLMYKAYKNADSIVGQPEDFRVVKQRDRKKQEDEWTLEAKKAEEDAYKNILGLDDQQYGRYNRLLRELKNETEQLRALEEQLSGYKESTHTPEDERDSYTLMTHGGSFSVEYVSPCSCVRCRYLVHKHMCDDTENNIKDILNENPKPMTKSQTELHKNAQAFLDRRQAMGRTSNYD